MKAVITRPMCVFGDNKKTVHFEPSTTENPFVEVSDQVYARLRRANAARLFVETDTTANSDNAVGQDEKIEIELPETLIEAAEKEALLEEPQTIKSSKTATRIAKKA